MVSPLLLSIHLYVVPPKENTIGTLARCDLNVPEGPVLARQSSSTGSLVVGLGTQGRKGTCY